MGLLIEGKWYKCIKNYIASLGNMVFIEGYRYKLHEKGFIVGENKIGVNLGENEELFLTYFIGIPFDENTEPTPTQYPKIMEVSDFPDFPKEATSIRVVFMETKNHFYAWCGAQTMEEANKCLGVNYFKFAREVSPIIEVSKKEIAEWKGVAVSQIQIID